jgi:hypothetical protein
VSLIQKLLSLDGFEGAAGTYHFSPEGTVRQSYELLQVVNGQLITLTK